MRVARVAAVLLLASALAAGQVIKGGGTSEVESQPLTVSGNTLTFLDALGTVTNTFEVIVNGGPATLTTTLNGVMTGGTVTALASSTSTTSFILSATGGPYTKYTITATWTGGVSPSITVNRYGTIARQMSVPGLVNAALQGGTDPCVRIANARLQVASSQSPEVLAEGLGSNDITTPCVDPTLIFGGQPALIRLGGYRMWIPMIPSKTGTADTPPLGPVVIPNNAPGLRGLGAGTATTSLNGVQGGTILSFCGPSTAVSCNYPGSANLPTPRAWAISTIAICTNGGDNNCGQGHGSAVRNYMQVNASRTVNITNIVGNGVTATATLAEGICAELDSVTPYNLVTIAGNTVGGFNAAQTVTGVSLGQNCNVFTFASATSGTGTGGTVVLGPNVVPGERIRIEGVNAGVSPDDGNWRVCQFTGGPAPVYADPNCPANPSVAASGVGTFYVTAQKTAFAATNVIILAQVACAAGCGNTFAQIPMIDITKSASAQFSGRVESIQLDGEGIVGAAGFRCISCQEISGLEHVKIAGMPEMGAEWYTTFAQGTTVRDLYIQSGPNMGAGGTACGTGMAALYTGDDGNIAVDGNVSVVYVTCATPPAAAWYYDSYSGATGEHKVHFENFVVDVVAGLDMPSSSFILQNFNGSPNNNANADGMFGGSGDITVFIDNQFPFTTLPGTADYSIKNIRRKNAPTAIVDLVVNSNTLQTGVSTDVTLEDWTVDTNTGGGITLHTSSPTIGDVPQSSNAILESAAFGAIGAANTTTYYTNGLNSVWTNNVQSNPKMPVACTVSGFYVQVQAAPTSALAVTLYRAGATTPVTCTISAAAQSCSDTTHIQAFSAGDSWNVGSLTAQAAETATNLRVMAYCR